MKKVASAIAVAGLIGTSAFAADLNRPAYKAALPTLQDWSGIYVGLECGYGWGKQSTDAISPGDQFSPPFTPVSFVPGATSGAVVFPQLLPPLFFPAVAVPSINQNGWLFGGFFGAQKQWGNWVLGIEGDIDGANIKGSGMANASSVTADTPLDFLFNTAGPTIIASFCSACFTLNRNVTIDSKIDALASVRGKIGWSFAPDWLIYGTGGAAFAHVENTIISSESGVTNPTFVGSTVPCGFAICALSSPTNILHNTSGGTTLFGWAVGGGVDWKLQLDAGSALVFGVEYLHYGFPDQTITLSDNAGGTFAFRARESVDAIKGRISYLFSIH
jgi:outer membrane immunogenic protein